MSEKHYRPIIKDGDHLVQSKKNFNRVIGQTRNAENKNPDIIEWEEVEDTDYKYEPAWIVSLNEESICSEDILVVINFQEQYFMGELYTL